MIGSKLGRGPKLGWASMTIALVRIHKSGICIAKPVVRDLESRLWIPEDVSAEWPIREKEPTIFGKVPNDRWTNPGETLQAKRGYLTVTVAKSAMTLLDRMAQADRSVYFNGFKERSGMYFMYSAEGVVERWRGSVFDLLHSAIRKGVETEPCRVFDLHRFATLGADLVLDQVEGRHIDRRNRFLQTMIDLSQKSAGYFEFLRTRTKEDLQTTAVRGW